MSSVPRLTEHQPGEAATEQRGGQRVAWSLGFLTLISSFNYLDRSLVGLLLPLIKADLALSDTVLGLISGLAFAVIYATLNLPIANLADRYSRRNIIAVGFAFWSAATALSGFVVNGVQLALCRFLVGAGEACGLAPSQSMIADLVSKERRPFALSIFSTAVAIDALIFLPIAALVAELYGWRTAFYVAGGGGLLLALAFFLTVREPPRQIDPQRGPSEPQSLTASMLLLWRIPAFRAILAGVTFMGAALYANGAWVSSMLVRVHGMSVSEVGLYVTPVRGILGIVGILGAGWLTQKLALRDHRWRFRIPALTTLCLVPANVAFLISDAAPVWITGLVVSAALQSAYQGPIFAATIALAPDRVKTVAVALKVFFAGMFGLALGPLFVGLSNDLLAPFYGEEAIRYSMLSMAACSLIGGLFFLRAGQLARDE